MSKPELDLNDVNVGFIITGLLGLVEAGYKPTEAFALMDEIKAQTWSALMEVYQGRG